MPYIEAKMSIKLDERQKDDLQKKLTGAVSAAFGKPKAYIMACIEDDKSLYMSPLTNLSTSISFEIDVTNINRIDIKVIPQREGNLRSGTSYVAISGLELS